VESPVLVMALCVMSFACGGESRKQPSGEVTGASGASVAIAPPTVKVLDAPLGDAVLARVVAEDHGEARVQFRPDGRSVAVLDETMTSLRVDDVAVPGYERFASARWLADGRLQFVAERGSAPTGGGFYVVRGQEVSGPFASAMALGRPGSDAVLVTPHAGQQAVFAGGKLGPAFLDVPVLDLVYGREGDLVAYVGVRETEACVVTRAGESCFPQLKRPVVSADESTVAVVMRDADGRVRAVVDGKRGPAFDDIEAVVLDHDGSVWACEAHQDGKQFVVIGDVQGERFDRVVDLRLSADGSAAAYYARNGNEAYLLAGGQRIPLPGSGTGELGFGTMSDLELSPDGKHFIALTKFPGGGKHYAIIDGAPGPYVDRAMFARMSFDGVAAYVAFDASQQRMSVGTTLGDPYDVVLPIEFGPTAGSFAYIARSGADQFVVTHRGAFGPYLDVGHPDPRPGHEVGKIHFGPRGEIVYRARTAAGWHLVVDGQPGPAFDQVFEPPTFTPTAIGYGVRKADQLRWVVWAKP
jgi:hypothetical protein